MTGMKLTQTEIDYLQSFLNNFDRGGYYTANYNLTGSIGTILEGRVSTFSGAVGGTAYGANVFLQSNFGATTAASSYNSIYVISQDVALAMQN
jgi:hypothetical protein